MRFALLELGFRPFYLLAACLAVLDVPLWMLQWQGIVAPFRHIAGMAWHAHEMVFGFAAAVITGFLFTAGRNWSGLPTPAGGLLACLALLWLAGRVVLITGPGVAAAIIDVAFLPAVALCLWFPLRRGSLRNLFFVPLLALLAFANAVFHLSWLGLIALPAPLAAQGALFVVTVIVSIMSGRVTPLFTANAIATARVRRNDALDAAAIAVLACALIGHLFGMSGAPLAVLALLAAVLHALRLWGWDPLATRHTPILWVLHVAYAWIPVAMVLLALSAITPAVPVGAALHALGVGAVGGSIIGMITRTARGHTQRPLIASSPEVVAYVLVIGAAALRVLAPLLFPSLSGALYLLAAAAWSSAFAIYLVIYTPWLVFSSTPAAATLPGR